MAKGKVIFFDAPARFLKVAKGFYPLRLPPLLSFHLHRKKAFVEKFSWLVSSG